MRSIPLAACSLLAFLCLTSVRSACGVHPRASSISDVHVVFSNHLDVGFTAESAQVVQRYFHEFFPRAIETARNLSQLDPPVAYTWTTQCWLVSLYLDCPTGMGFDCPSTDQQQQVESAIRKGVIAWHAFPFNAQLESMSAWQVQSGVRLCHSLNDRFGQSHGATLSQRDVPGMTRAVLPLLVKSGVNSISVGVNAYSAPPAFPAASVWRDPQSKAEVVLLYHPHGYGGQNLSDATVVDGLSHALMPVWRNDNDGPQFSDEVLEVLEWIEGEFPHSRVYASTFDAFTQRLWPMRDKLPVVTAECGDTWIWGVASDPIKLALMRSTQRAVEQCLQSAECDSSSAAFANFTRLFLKGGEHTWGGDTKVYLDGANPNGVYYAWNNSAFAAVRNSPEMKSMEATWHEQRRWAIYGPLSALPDKHPIVQAVQADLQRIRGAREPDVSSMTPHPLNAGPVPFFTPTVRFALCPHYGFIVSLTAGGVTWNSWDRPLAALRYQTLDESQFVAFHEWYGQCDAERDCTWATYDFGKQGMQERANPKAQIVQPRVTAMYSRRDNQSGALTLLVALQFDHQLTVDYGAPQQAWLRYNVSATEARIDLDVLLLNKTATRLAESLWLTFDPTRDSADPAFWLHKLGSRVRSDDVMRNGSQTLHALDGDGASVLQKRHDGSLARLQLSSLDCALVHVAPLALLLPLPRLDPAVHTPADVLAFNLVNNAWGTNFVMHFPFVDEDASIALRFSMQVLDEEENAHKRQTSSSDEDETSALDGERHSVLVDETAAPAKRRHLTPASAIAEY